MTVNGILKDFRRDGVVMLDNVIEQNALKTFRMQVAAELDAPSLCAESGVASPVHLSEPGSWPQGSARRVVEVVPAASGNHWQTLVAAPKLRAALDALLGVDAWELPFNTFERGKVIGRHWYCPVVFPETRGIACKEVETPSMEFEHVIRLSQLALGTAGCSLSPGLSQGDHRQFLLNSKNKCPVSRRETLFGTEWRLLRRPHATIMHMPRLEVEKLSEVLEVSNGEKFFHNSQPPSIFWEAVNRRRVRGKGWHIDVGSSFQSIWARKLVGHRDQGVILLVLLSDSMCGGGGTAFVRGSHKWIAEKIASHNPYEMRHLELNIWASTTVSDATVSGFLKPVLIDGLNDKPEGCLGKIEQVIGEAGSIILAHPWLIHAGTTNLLHVPRIMVNGMARMKNTCSIKGSRESLRDLGSTSSTQKQFVWQLEKQQAQVLEGEIYGGGDADDDDDVDGNCDTEDVVCDSKSLPFDRQCFSREQGTSCLDRREYDFGLAVQAHQQTLLPRILHMETNKLKTISCLPTASIIVPVHNSISWIHECLASVLRQSYQGPIEVSLYDDASTDGSDVAICAWAFILRGWGVSVVASGSFWEACGTALPHYKRPAEHELYGAGGIGHSKNQAVKQSFGKYLVFLDSDDIMLTRRLEAQISLVMKNPGSIVGGCWRRHPLGSTCHYEHWANGLNAQRIWLEQFREVSVQMPTWCMSRCVFETVGGFVESPPQDGEVRTF